MNTPDPTTPLITLSHHFDGAEWTNAPADAGSLRTGPHGLLQLLESRLGLGVPQVHPAQRIEAWMRRMEAIDAPGMWFHESFEADRWSTAATLLGFRAELVEAGWRPGIAEDTSPRLQALSRIEALSEPEVPPGSADRMRAIFAEVEALSSEIELDEIADEILDTPAIKVIDNRDHFSPAWRELLTTLERCGVRLYFAGDEGDRTSPPGPPSDIDYYLLTADDEWEAAETIATWLAAGDDAAQLGADAGHASTYETDATSRDRQGAPSSANTSVTLLCGSESTVLDAALGERGLPRVGRGSSSRWRGALQLLPLFLENVWKPVDVARLAELLSLEYGPIPRAAANNLLHALTQEPGVGGRKWSEALEKIAEKLGKEKAQEFDRLLSSERFDPEDGVPGEVVAKRCRIIADRLAPRMEHDPTAAVAVGHAQVLEGLCQDGDRIPRNMLERMMDTIIGGGAADFDSQQEASAWRVASDPGEIVDACETVIWWNFTDAGSPRTARWSTTEREALSERGVHLPLAETAHFREAASWQRPAAAARSRLIMVYPKRLHGEEAPAHPNLDELKAAAKDSAADDQSNTSGDRGAEQNINLRYENADTLFRGPEFAFAGRTTSLEAATPHEKPDADGRYRIAANAIDRPTKLSYSSMNELLGCPMKWILSNRAKLQASGAADIPHGNQMIGTLCHRIVELLFRDSPPGAVNVEQQAVELFDDLVGSMASELLLPGRELERRRARAAVGLAVRRLAESLERNGLTVETTEDFLEVDVNGVALRGPADLIARDRSGQAFIIDLKWSGSSRYHREEIERGEALQLAVYAWMVRRRESAGDDDRQHAHAGAAYFMLAQGELLSKSANLAEAAIEAGGDEENIFDRAWTSWEMRLSHLNGGTVEATGVTQADRDADELRQEWRDSGGLYREPPCRFCDYGWLCGLEGDTV